MARDHSILEAESSARTVEAAVGDTLAEGLEAFAAAPTSPTNATVADGPGQATILADDSRPGQSGQTIAVGQSWPPHRRWA